VPVLRGKVICNLFFETSTRTRTTFELAAKRLSADVVNFNINTSATTKGETLLDTLRNLEAMHVDMFVVRHADSGAAHFIAQHVSPGVSVVNAGDGRHAHPTQAMLDMFTIRRHKGDFAPLKIAIVGDILHSRVARSTSMVLRKIGVEVAFLGPGSLVPREGPDNIRRFTDYQQAMAWAPDFVYLLRVQMERQDVQYFPSLREYHKLYGITEARLAEIRDRGLFIMHPGPVNRGVELCDAVMDYERTLINDQVENGVAVRMAVLYWLKPGAAHQE